MNNLDNFCSFAYLVYCSGAHEYIENVPSAVGVAQVMRSRTGNAKITK